jgi:hypothetical protein
MTAECPRCAYSCDKHLSVTKSCCFFFLNNALFWSTQIEDGEIFATINQKDGMVRFHDNPEKYNSAAMLLELGKEVRYILIYAAYSVRFSFFFVLFSFPSKSNAFFLFSIPFHLLSLVVSHVLLSNFQNFVRLNQKWCLTSLHVFKIEESYIMKSVYQLYISDAEVHCNGRKVAGNGSWNCCQSPICAKGLKMLFNW